MITILIAIAAVCLIAAILLIVLSTFRMFSKLRDKNDKVYDEEFNNKNQSK